jgi:hypothetical protein
LTLDRGETNRRIVRSKMLQERAVDFLLLFAGVDASGK